MVGGRRLIHPFHSSFLKHKKIINVLVKKKERAIPAAMHTGDVELAVDINSLNSAGPVASSSVAPPELRAVFNLVRISVESP